jgi:hypothetical protein
MLSARPRTRVKVVVTAVDGHGAQRDITLIHK